MPREYPIMARLYVGHKWDLHGLTSEWTVEHVYDGIAKTLSRLNIPGATLSEGLGVWRGKREPCTIVDVLCANFDEMERVRDAAQLLQGLLNQEAVLLVTHSCRSERVGA